MERTVICFFAILLVNCLCAAATSCSEDFTVLESSLLQSSSNRFRLLKAFYPAREAHPVIVKATYSFTAEQEEAGGAENDALSSVWFWSESGFYLIQPLEVFQCTSLLFSNLLYRSGTVELELPQDCYNSSQELMELLTVRLKLYAQSATTSPSSGTLRISDDYIAVAASEEEIASDSLQSTFLKVWLHITLVLFPLGSLLVIYICDPVQLLLGDKTWFILEDEHMHGTISALLQISILIVFYIFIMDLAGIYFTISTTVITAPSHSAFYISTITAVFIDVAAFIWVVFVIFYSTIYILKSYFGQKTSLYLADHIAYTRVKKLLTSTVLAAILSFFNHIHFVILAFIADPFHAGSVAIMFIVFFFIFYFVLRQFYNRVVLHSNKHPGDVSTPHKLCTKCIAKLQENSNRSPQKRRKKSLLDSQIAYLQSSQVDKQCDCFISGPGCHTPFSVRVVILSLCTVCPFLLVYVGMITVVFFSLPLTKTIEDSPSRLYSIYQGTGLIIVALLSYNILLRPASFSIVKVTERLAKRLRLPDHTNYWNKLTDEEKCAKVVATLMEKHFQSELFKTFPSEETDSVSRTDPGDLTGAVDEIKLPDTLALVAKQSSV